MKRKQKTKSKAQTPKPKPSKRPVERIEYRRGGFVHGYIRGGPEDTEALLEVLQANSPGGRIAKWKPHAERLGVGLDEIVEAESLIDEFGQVSDLDRFDLCMARAQSEIDLAQVEKSFVPLAVYGAKAKEDRTKGAEETRRVRARDRGERNRRIQETINHLCLRQGHSFKRACEIVSRTLKDPDTGESETLHPDHIRKRIARNPLRKK